MTDLPIKIRGLSHPEIPLFDDQGTVTNQEKAFIASSWSHKERANPAYFWVSKRAFHYQFYLGVIVPLIDERPEYFRIAYNTDKPDQILGWACIHFGRLYKWHVKDEFEDYGITRFLIPNAVQDVSSGCSRAFMELINDQRKETKTDSVPGIKERTRQADQEHPGSLSRTPVPQGS